MFKIPSLVFVILFAILAGATLVAVEDRFGISLMLAYSAPPEDAKEVARVWDAAAPGRIQPKGGEVHIAASTQSTIREVSVILNDQVKAGDLLVRLDDEELQAKLVAAKATAAVKMTERDNLDVRGLALDRRKAEDRLYTAERNLFDARLEFDRIMTQLRVDQATQADVDKARTAIVTARDKVDQEQTQLKRVQASEKMPALIREEADLASARSEVSVICAALERTRIRAPVNGTVLQINAKRGEVPGSIADGTLLVLGDTTHLEVRAEVEERDIGKIKPGQLAVVKSDAFPGRLFNAEVSVVAKAMGVPQLISRALRKPTDIDVLEVQLPLEDGTPLLPGMRVDVFFKAQDTSPKTSSN